MASLRIGSKAFMDNKTGGRYGDANTGGIATVRLYMYSGHWRCVEMIPRIADLVCLD